MNSEEFWSSTAKEFFLRLQAFFEYQPFLQNQEWIRMRWQTTILVNIKLPKDKQIKPTDLFEFDYEQKPKDLRVMSAEKSAELNAKWDAEMKRIYAEKMQAQKTQKTQIADANN